MDPIQQTALELNTQSIHDSESEILRNANLDVGDKIIALIAEQDDQSEEAKGDYLDELQRDNDSFAIQVEDDTGAIDDFEVADGTTTTSASSTQPVGRYRRMLPCEREYLLDYVAKPA